MKTLEGRTIVRVRTMTRAEATREGWCTTGRHGAPAVLELDDGSVLYASADEEGNAPGALFGRGQVGGGFVVAGR